MTRAAPVFSALLIFLGGCSPGYRYVGSRIDWREPFFLEDGRIGLFQVAWDEYEASCGYFGSTTCLDIKRVNVHFIAFSPEDGSLDTLFEARPGKYEPAYPVHLHVVYSPPRIFYYHDFAPGVYDMETGKHLLLDEEIVIGVAFSRSGNYLTKGLNRVNASTGTIDQPLPFSNFRFSYYDDVADKAILARDSIRPDNTWDLPPQSPASMLYDFASGMLDSSKAWPTPGQPGSRRAYLVRGPLEKSGNVRKYAVTPRATLNLAQPEYDTVTVTAARYYLDIDLSTRRTVAANSGYSEPEEGITVGDFDGNETVYRARDFHPDFPSPP